MDGYPVVNTVAAPSSPNVKAVTLPKGAHDITLLADGNAHVKVAFGVSIGNMQTDNSFYLRAATSLQLGPGCALADPTTILLQSAGGANNVSILYWR